MADLINNSIVSSGPQVVVPGDFSATNIIGGSDPFSGPSGAGTPGTAGGGGLFGSGNSGIFGTGATVGGGISSIFSGIGSLEEAASYKTAATIAAQNAQISKNSGQVQEKQLTRQIQQTLGKQQAEVGGAGLKVGSGTAGFLYKSSMAQGSLAKQLVNLQTDINVNGFEQEATQYKGMASAAKTAGIGGIFGGVLGIFGL